MIDVAELRPGGLEAVVDRVVRQLPDGERQRPLAMLDAREALLFGGRDDGAVAHQARGRIVEGGVDTQRDGAATSVNSRASCKISISAASSRSGATLRRQSCLPAGQMLF